MAEDITGRFLNVVNLFNGFIPVVAIQMSAWKVGQQAILVFTTVLSELSLGLPDEEADDEPTDRAYWEKRGTKETVAIADELLRLIKEFDPALELNFTKVYIGLARDGQTDNFVLFQPRKNKMWLRVRLDQSEQL